MLLRLYTLIGALLLSRYYPLANLRTSAAIHAQSAIKLLAPDTFSGGGHLHPQNLSLSNILSLREHFADIILVIRCSNSSCRTQTNYTIPKTSRPTSLASNAEDCGSMSKEILP